MSDVLSHQRTISPRAQTDRLSHLQTHSSNGHRRRNDNATASLKHTGKQGAFSMPQGKGPCVLPSTISVTGRRRLSLPVNSNQSRETQPTLHTKQGGHALDRNNQHAALVKAGSHERAGNLHQTIVFPTRLSTLEREPTRPPPFATTRSLPGRARWSLQCNATSLLVLPMHLISA